MLGDLHQSDGIRNRSTYGVRAVREALIEPGSSNHHVQEILGFGNELKVSVRRHPRTIVHHFICESDIEWILTS